AVATLADPQNGKVLHLGFNPARTKAGWRGQKANLQSLGKRRLLHKIRNKQCRRTKYENHVVSKQIVDYAAKHRRCIVLEKLENVKGKDSPLRRTVAVVFLSVAPVHSVQGRFARRNGNRSRPCVYLAGMLSLPSVDQAQRKEVRLWEVRTQ